MIVSASSPPFVFTYQVWLKRCLNSESRDAELPAFKRLNAVSESVGIKGRLAFVLSEISKVPEGPGQNFRQSMNMSINNGDGHSQRGLETVCKLEWMNDR